MCKEFTYEAVKAREASDLTDIIVTIQIQICDDVMKIHELSNRFIFFLSYFF